MADPIIGTNSFSKEERVAFDQVLEGFEDALVISKSFAKYKLDDVMAERAGNTIWRPQPYIAQSFTGVDQTANFNRNYTQLSVPATLGYTHSVPLTLSAVELRDQLQEKRLGDSATQRLASNINVDCMNLASLSGTIVVDQTAAPSGFNDIALCAAAMNRVGVPMDNRKCFLTSDNYYPMAGNLATPSRSFGNPISDEALRNAWVGKLAGMDTFMLDYGYRLAAAASGPVTIGAAGQNYVPAATVSSNGTFANVDNRYQTVVVSGTFGVKVGDAFTLAGVDEVHHITKTDTGSPKTFRVTAVVDGTHLQISPPIISGSGGTDPEIQYQNCTATPANGASLTWLNQVSANVNPFWQADALEIIPGCYAPAANSGMAMMRATTESGINVQMTRQGSVLNLNTLYRWDVFYGLVNKQPEMSGCLLFNQ